MTAMPRGRLLVGLPFLPAAVAGAPSTRFLRALVENEEVDVYPATPSPDDVNAARELGDGKSLSVLPGDPRVFASTIKKAAARGNYRAVLILDGEATRPAAVELCEYLPHVPVVLVVFDGESPKRVDALACVDEVWSLGGRVAPPRGALPKVFRRAPLDAKGVARLTATLGKPAREKKKHARASVIIPCWNGLAYTKQCLDSVLKRTTAPFEVIVVDNGSKDGTADYVRSLKDKRIKLIVNKHNLGFARAINQGTAAASGEYFIWLNSDAVVTPGWLDRMIATADRAPWVGAVGPLTNEINGPQRVAKVPYKNLAGLPLFSETVALRNDGRARDAHRLTGFCLLVKREAARNVGTLDEGFGAGTYEDFDYCLRLRMAGYQLLLAEDVFIHHHGHKTFQGAGIEHTSASAANREIFIDKWCRRAMSFLDELDPHLNNAPARRRR
jgi:GT2 family glycosyltransferase